MNQDEIRKFIEKKIFENKLNYRRISMDLGKGAAYMQRYLKGGVPARLPEDLRKKLAVMLKVDERLLTDLDISIKSLPSENDNTVSIDIIAANPCCGSGNDNEFADEVVGKWIMPTKDFKDLTFAKPENIKQMRVIGDSMEPTIKDGDYILADTSFKAFSIDGIYLIRMYNGLAVKRLQAGLNDIKILSDNKKYEPITAAAGEVYIIGKVIKIMNIENV